MHEQVDHLPTQILKYKQKSSTDNNKIPLTMKFPPSDSVQCIPLFPDTFCIC